jgi:DNA-damage-inducible protein D
MQDIPHTSPFDASRRTADDGSEYWSARELYKLLGYSTWQRFQLAIEHAKIACQQSGQGVSSHFNIDVKIVKAGATTKHREDYQLSRYACYLIVMNADSSKPIVALGQTYFAVQTRRQEVADELALSTLPEDQKRLIYRSEMAVLNARLADAAKGAGVITPTDFSTFQDHGYMGLYAGLTENAIHSRKGLTSEKQKILDYMGSDELIANAFRASLTRQKLDGEQIKGKGKANKAHREVGGIVRKAIAEAGGTMPENLPTPAESIQELQQKEQKRLKRGPQGLLFDDPGSETQS